MKKLFFLATLAFALAVGAAVVILHVQPAAACDNANC